MAIAKAASNRRIAQLFDQAAESYDDRSNLYAVGCRTQLLASFASGRCLELGGGTGEVLARLADRGRAIHSDIAPRMCRQARRKLGCPSVCFDAEFIPLGDGSIDSAVSAEMIYYLERPQCFLAEAHRVLRPGGRLVLSTTNPAMTFLERGRTLLRRLGFSRMFFDDGSPPFLALDRLTAMLEQTGFTIEEVRHIVVLPFACLDRLNRLLERMFLGRFGLFILIVAKKNA
jgi:ubiquinone/menaquinone biosynthesis C-methylase UbiE